MANQPVVVVWMTDQDFRYGTKPSEIALGMASHQPLGTLIKVRDRKSSWTFKTSRYAGLPAVERVKLRSKSRRSR
jgi:hypothetical protein